MPTFKWDDGLPDVWEGWEVHGEPTRASKKKSTSAAATWSLRGNRVAALVPMSTMADKAARQHTPSPQVGNMSGRMAGYGGPATPEVPPAPGPEGVGPH